MSNPDRLRCPQCRTRRTDPYKMVLHVLQCGRPLCHCMRVPHPHRPGSFPLCEQTPGNELRVAERMGATPDQLDDLAVELAWEGVGCKRAVECPF